MAFKIGFTTDNNPTKAQTTDFSTMPNHFGTPRKSLVEIFFADRHYTLTYYNDQFDLKCGDLVYVDGKLEGLRGRVTAVNYNFKIKVSDYKRVVAVVDTTVKGEFFTAGSHFITFDRDAIPRKQVLSWFKAPCDDEEEVVSSSDDTSFTLKDPSAMKVTSAVASRGHDYYLENKVRYICLDGTKGYAIVEGSKPYEVEFDYRGGEISKLICSCFCINNCKHELAAMLQLSDLLENIEKHYSDEYERSDYFAAIVKGTLFSYAIDGKEKVSFTL